MKNQRFLSNLSVVCLLLLSFSGKAQVNFNDYHPLQSKGAVPEDFSIETSQKIKQAQQERRDGLTSKQQKIFVEQVNYTIDDLLKSGLVTYGDEVTTYIQRIGDRLTASDPDLEGKLRFYTLNTNEANAFSTDQGMVFVTTGLIAQMTNEAQLAFVLAHEIVHYQEEHVLDLYDYVNDNKSLSYGEKVRFFSKYSRDNEFEADKLGVKLYHAAGYSSTEITKTFDILIYSYLPFEELPFNKEYFNSSHLFVPEKTFKARKNEITAKQRYDDQFNSHPNVAKRIEALEKEIAAYADWGTILNFPEQSFEEVRGICRFEYILNEVYENKTIDALYSIFVMEQEYPNSRFLNRCKAQIWLEVMKEEKRDSYGFNPYINFDNRYERQFYEGEISLLNHFFTQVPDEGKVALGLRIIHDLYVSDTTDALMGRMWQKGIEVAAANSVFELETFSKHNFDQAIANIELERLAQQAGDSVGEHHKRWDKYETIKNQRSGLTVDAGIDSSKFYLYGIADLINDSTFNRQFETYHQKVKEEELEDEEFFTMTDEEQLAIETEKYEDQLHLDLDTVLLVNPFVTEFSKRDELDFQKSDVLEERLLTVVQEVGSELGVVVNRLDRSQLQSMTTQQYNDLALIMRTIEKGVQTTEPDVFMIDLERLDSLKLVYGSSKVMLLSLQHNYNDHINAASGVVFTILFPIGMIYFPVALLTAHTTEMNVYIMDLEKGELVVEKSYYSKDQVSKKMLASRCHALFSQLKETSNEN
jgi:Zn-dependent protease with chaperone function